MSTIRGPVNQSVDEVRSHVFEYANDLLAGVSITSATAIHIPPKNGEASTPDVNIQGSIVYVTLGPLAATGRHILDCNAACDDDEILNIRLLIDVIY